MNSPVNPQLLVEPLTAAPKKSKPPLLQRLMRKPLTAITVAICLLGTAYEGFIASDRYVSEARVIIQHTDSSSNMRLDVSSILSGDGGGGRGEQMLLRDYLLSIDMLNKLDAKLNLRSHYSDQSHDFLSRMWSKDAPQELFYKHYLSRVSVEFDDYAGVLVIKAQGYDPRTAHAITAMLLEEGERAMNDMGHRLAQDQVAFVEKKVKEMAGRFQEARRAVLEYQNKKGLVSPESTAETLAVVINRLEAQRAELQAKRTALLGYLAPTASGVVELNVQLDAIEKQIAKEQAKLTSPNGKTLNSTVEEYQRLEMAAGFAQDTYKAALVALEKGQVEATRTLKKVTALQQPTVPQYPEEPARIYNIVLFILVTLILSGIVHLIAAIVRDHKD